MGIINPKVGARSMVRIGLANALFSGVQQRVLGLIFGNPDRSFYKSEIVRKVHSGVGAVDRELSRLRSAGLVAVEQMGNQIHYRANRQSPIFEELRSIVMKTVGLAEPLRASLKPYAKKIKAAFVFGSVAKASDTTQSDIDLMVIGNDLSYSDLFDALLKAEAVLGRKVSPKFLAPDDWKRKLAQKEPFITKITAQPKIFIFGSEDDLQS